MRRIILFISLLIFQFKVSAQYDWKLQKDREGIKIYTSSTTASSFKAVKVECTLTGTYSKLISILTNVDKFEDWIYNNKLSKLVSFAKAPNLIRLPAKLIFIHFQKSIVYQLIFQPCIVFKITKILAYEIGFNRNPPILIVLILFDMHRNT